jgi:hypothetical protein
MGRPFSQVGRRIAGVGAIALTACASSPPAQWEVHHVGRVEAVRVVQTNRPTGHKYVGLYALGAVGGAVAGALQSFPSTITRYSLRTKNNEVVEVEWPEELQVGSCIAVLGESNDAGGLSYPFPMGRVVPSSECR